MISAHQPTIFGPSLIVALSSKSDGNMRFGTGDDDQVRQNRQAFLRQAGIDIDHTTLIRVTYDANKYDRYRIAEEKDKTRGITAYEEIQPADALVTDQLGHALFLLLADCVGAIIYDQTQRVVMVSHLGRHSAEIDGAAKSIKYLKEHFSCDPGSLKVWLSPGVGSATYPLEKFGGRGLHEVIIGQLQKAGVRQENIERADVDTAISKDYYSHSEYMKGNQTGPARFAIVAQMIAQGAPAR